ncbi:DDE superfamily endonuclease [Popillia japonica]|uniref:DDE superfamily endonuclease n=1 Tax=Popillia japonica TaxID=7064 RepID=A0AAW1MCM5_POPJA
MNQLNFPGVIGAIDGTHVAIMKPLNEHNFINRKGYHSLNVQIICDSTMKVLNINANFGGSTHDSFIWRHSGIQRQMQQLYRNGERCWLIGDSGYPLQPYLLTPVLNAAPGTPEANYNAAHATARNIIERTITCYCT